MDFVKIESVFSDKINRSVEDLSKVYVNKTLLAKKIRNVSKGIFDLETIRGKKIFLKPNWVVHNTKKDDEICLRTNDSFLLTALEIILENKPASITIGDAPIQRCSWELILTDKFKSNINTMGEKYCVPIVIKDFRRVTFDPKQNNPIKERNPLSSYVIFDLGKDSCLDPISSSKNIFRVLDYDPERLAESHTNGIHKYCITKEFFDADIVISLPKIKTHQKTGITGALKNIVGLNGDKDYLPHHRIGGTRFGGDCYPGGNVFRRIAEWALDNANRQQGKSAYFVFRLVTSFLWRISMPQKIHQLGAGWYGNDTCWRMVTDLNKIAVFGKKDGTLSKTAQRELYSLCDGIVGGQGDGPLNPEPLPLGVICFSNNSQMADICLATLMGFDIQKISLLRNAHQQIHHKKIEITLNEKKIDLLDLVSLSIPTIPPPGWVDHLVSE